jgi:hypothetical protein
MTLTNAYAELADFMALPEITSPAPVDDVFIEQLLERASRAIDAYCGTWFYASSQTRTFDLPRGRELALDAPLLAITTLTNGDDVVIASTEYNLLPHQGPHRNSVKLLASSTTTWMPALAGDTEGVITLAGTWGYVDRTATDPESVAIILNTTDACLSIALAAYKRRYGVGVEGVAQVTGAGVVITPRGMPAEAKQLLTPYVSHL